MNRFRGRKKVRDDMAPPRPSVESESSSPFKMFGKNKKSQEEEPKAELDLATALPSNDDFRTSLLMTNLSARFSMLREQDDPNTKVGKASDDSVLYSNKRQSRLTDFGFGAGLSDIAEVESIRAPFARNSDYQSDDNASTTGSVMTRSKPTEGNNLFGGRQKIYKISGAGGRPGATSGRALYGDDVAQSAFQKWRQAEKEREADSLDELQQSESLDSDIPRPDSPQQSEYNRRRETSSTTSSAPSGARNSTAATSITSSQPSQSVKDWQSATAASNPTPPIERSVTRTRRLYEQGLNQDLHNSQTSALSRIDTLSKQRTLNRTPDLTPTVPSPSSATFSDRFANSRSILNKASAPNLRSFSPPTSQASPVESQHRFPGFEERTSFGATPPLSPPISETGEHQALSLPSETTKPAATSVLAKVAQYDESRYAQRQIQLQRGRETPTNRFRTDSNASGPTIRSRSPSTQRPALDKHDSNSFSIEAALKEEGQTSTFFDDEEEDEDEGLSNRISARSGLPAPPQVTVERPADHEHPAFRKSALPTPLSLEKDDSRSESPEDSPTLGPTTGGLSGMVRAHLRQDSNASSIYGAAPNDSDLVSRFPSERDDVQTFEPVTKTHTWESIERGVAMSMEHDLPSPTMTKSSLEPRYSVAEIPSIEDSNIDEKRDNETDDFARHLADGARRVRERLTSYAESDSGTSAPPAPPISELPPPPRPNALGILKAKSSRGSLVDRTRGERDNQSTKAKKLLGLSSSASSTSLHIARPDSTDPDAKQGAVQSVVQPIEPSENEGRPSVDRDNVHVGLKAFRQARRELQRMKEIEVQQRYQAPQKAPQAPSPIPPQMSARERAPSLRGPSSRQPSQERRPPVAYNRIPSEESWNGPSSRSASRATSERERSGSENSSGGRSGSRPPRLRNGSVPRDEFHAPMGSPGLNGMPKQGPMMRSPSHPRSNGAHSPVRFNRFGEPSPNLGMPPRTFEHGQPSPISPMNGAPSPYGPPSQRPFPHHPGNLDLEASSKRMMRPRDPTDPPMMSPSSSGPVGQRGGIPPNVNGSAPPVPPINPRRKTNTMSDFARRSEDEAGLRGRMPMSPAGADESRSLSAFANDDEGSNYRQRLRKATSEANGMNGRARSLRNSPPHPSMPPPMPPNMAGNGLPGGMI